MQVLNKNTHFLFNDKSNLGKKTWEKSQNLKGGG